MPLPNPNPSEKQNDFVSRCMSSSIMNSDYPDQKQRAVICYSQYKKRKSSNSSQEPDWDDCEKEIALILL